jgi:hypothetical protein
MHLRAALAQRRPRATGGKGTRTPKNRATMREAARNIYDEVMPVSLQNAPACAAAMSARSDA